jgi:hypothetical protein
MSDHNAPGLANAQHFFDVGHIQLARKTIPYSDCGSPCERRHLIIPAITAGLNLTRNNRLWDAMGVKSHLQLSYLCISLLWSYVLMHDAIIETVPAFPEDPFRIKGHAIIWDEISIIGITAVPHTFKGYVRDVLEKEIFELTYAQTMCILGTLLLQGFGFYGCAHSGVSGPPRGH